MKRIVKKYTEFIFENMNKYLYHGTSLENAENMIKNGLSEETYWGSQNNAENYSYSYENPVLIKIDYNEMSDSIEPNNTLIDYYYDNNDDNDYDDIIEKWENSEQTALDSLNIFDSVILPQSPINISFSNIIKLK